MTATAVESNGRDCGPVQGQGGNFHMPFGGKRKWLAAGAAALTIVATACSSSSKPASSSSATTSAAGATGSSSGGSGSGQTYTLGVLTDLTGVAASAAKSTPMGVQAAVGLANSEGYHIKYVVADTGSSPAGALTAAQKLVDQDHVFAVIAVSGLTFGAAPFLAAHHIPVIGSASDATEWISTPSMFSIIGTEDYTKVYSTFGQFFKQLAATNIASLGYSISPSSSESAKGIAQSVEAAGLKSGYLNANFPFGGTDVGPVALAMKSAGVDGFDGSIELNTFLALNTALRQEGVNLKVPMTATGYGGDLLQGGPGASVNAQGVYFLSSYEPIELHTAATERLTNALKTYAGISGDPTSNEYWGYVAVDAFLTGLKAAGSNPTQASLMSALLGITHYNAAGLYGSHSIGFAMNQRGQAFGADNCVWIAKYQGSTFHLVNGMEPICGSVIAGRHVSSSS
jgi:branched-chain amino acid transport system substrate-binding protein